MLEGIREKSGRRRAEQLAVSLGVFAAILIAGVAAAYFGKLRPDAGAGSYRLRAFGFRGAHAVRTDAALVRGIGTAEWRAGSEPRAHSARAGGRAVAGRAARLASEAACGSPGEKADQGA